MRTVQNFAHSPATQPYNQTNKPYSHNHAMNQPPMSTPGAYGQPISPTPNYGHNQDAPNPVTPPTQYTQNNGGVRETEVTPVAHQDANIFNTEEDFFGGPPMGGNVQGGGQMADLQCSLAPTPTSTPTSNHYHGVVNGMASLSVRPGVPQPYAEAQPQPSPQMYPTHEASSYQAPGPNANGYSNDGYWGGPPQPYEQQQQNNYTNANANPNQLPDWSQHPPQPQQQTNYTNVNPNQLPDWSQHPPARTPYEYENSGNHQRNKEHESLDDHKRSVDLIREQGAHLRALRLLDETTVNDLDPYGEYTPEPEPQRSLGSSIKKAAMKEIAKNQNARQVRKMKMHEYKNKKTEMLAESSRTVTNVRRGFDPELTSDKCQLDFDRQRDAQIKALRLINSNIF